MSSPRKSRSAKGRAEPGLGEATLGPITVHFPDASTAEFWFMEDLAGVLGVETNAEAEERLTAALGPSRRGIDLDSEADNVLAHAKGAATMTRLLGVLDSLAMGRPLWSADDLARAEAAMGAWRRPKPVAYDVGAVVAVPLRDGSFGAAHVAAFADAGSIRGSPLVLALDVRAPRRDDLVRVLEDGAGRAVGSRVVIDCEIPAGEWPVVGHRAVDDEAAQALVLREQGTSSSGPVLTAFIEAYFGLRAWDEPFDPRANELMLLPGIAPPASRHYLRDLVEGRLVAAFGKIPAAVNAGPALLDVHIAYPGSGLPRLIDLPKSRQMAERMRREVPGVGEVLAGGGRGFLDVFATTTDAAAGLRVVEATARELGIARETMVEAFPVVALDGLPVRASP